MEGGWGGKGSSFFLRPRHVSKTICIHNSIRPRLLLLESHTTLRSHLALGASGDGDPKPQLGLTLVFA